MFVACHAWAGLLHSPGSYRRARYRWFIPPNLSCTVAGGRLPFTQHEWAAISLHDHINSHLRSLSAHISSEVAASCSAAPGLVLGADVLTSRRSHVCDPQGQVKGTNNPQLMPPPWLVIHSPAPTHHHVMYAVVIWLETLELNARCCFYWAFMEAVWLASVMSYAYMQGMRQTCHLPLL